jgi:hypothetical protein
MKKTTGTIQSINLPLDICYVYFHKDFCYVVLSSISLADGWTGIESTSLRRSYYWVRNTLIKRDYVTISGTPQSAVSHVASYSSRGT